MQNVISSLHLPLILHPPPLLPLSGMRLQCMTDPSLAGSQGKRVAISGSGNVAIYAAYKCLELGAKVITLSDSGGYHIVEEGMTKEMIDAIDDIKVVKKGRLHEYKNDKGEPAANDDFLV